MEQIKKYIRLPKGSILEVEVKDGFYDKIVQHFGLNDKSEVCDDHIRMFIFGAVSTAVDQAEKESPENR